MSKWIKINLKKLVSWAIGIPSALVMFSPLLPASQLIFQVLPQLPMLLHRPQNRSPSPIQTQSLALSPI